ncbi:MAG: hypothetical protein L7S72_07930 [Flavobacteriales bacterium]|nr:hypothetical protein [Flavobacteriales bacterium]
MKINNVEKAMEGRSDGSTAKEIMKLAEKDPVHHIELELSNAIERAYEEAKENGFKGSIEEYIKTAPLDELKSLAMAGGGSVDFSSMSPGQMKAIFISENGREPKNVKELVRGVKMYLKNMDIKGLPFGVFDE